MAEDEQDRLRHLFARIRAFGWSEDKRASIWHQRKIDFRDMKGVFDGETLIRRSDHHEEIRYQVFGIVDGREVAIICTLLGEQCWIISARRASRKERQEYYDYLARRSSPRED